MRGARRDEYELVTFVCHPLSIQDPPQHWMDWCVPLFFLLVFHHTCSLVYRHGCQSSVGGFRHTLPNFSVRKPKPWWAPSALLFGPVWKHNVMPRRPLPTTARPWHIVSSTISNRETTVGISSGTWYHLMDPPPQQMKTARNVVFFKKRSGDVFWRNDCEGWRRAIKRPYLYIRPPLSLLLHSNKSRPRSVCRYRVYIDV